MPSNTHSPTEFRRYNEHESENGEREKEKEVEEEEEEEEAADEAGAGWLSFEYRMLNLRIDRSPGYARRLTRLFTLRQ